MATRIGRLGAWTGDVRVRRLRTLSRTESFGLAAVGLLFVLAVIGPSIAPYPTTMADSAHMLLAPSVTHPFGTDENGMDILSRILAAPRVDVTVAFVSIIIAFVVGTSLGVFAGFFEGSRRRASSLAGESILRLLDVIQAFPVFILAMVLVASRGASTENIIVAIAFVNLPVFLRISRAEVLTLRQRPYAEAAHSIGAKDRSVAFRHLLPNALPPLITQVSATMGFAILLTAGLSFVGAGVNPPTPELGGMVSTGASGVILGYWWPSFFPGVALGLVVFSFAAAGQALEHLLEPRSTRTREAIAGASGVTPEAGSMSAAEAASLGAGPSDGIATDPRPTSLHVAADLEVPFSTGGETPSDEPTPIDLGPARPPECLLTVDGLSVEFAHEGSLTRVIDRISVWVAPGEALGIVGEAGSGKSVLVRAILRLLPAEGRIVEGSIRYRDEDLLSLDPHRLRALRAVEFSPILPNAKDQLSPVSRVSDLMVVVYRAHARASRKVALEKAVEALRMVGIQDAERRLRAYPHELSGGMAQRVCIAMSLLHSPRLLIADEPTAGLDVTVQRQVLDQLVAAAHERGAAQLIVTRDLGIVAQYCQRVAVMHHGRIVETGRTADVFGQPRHAYTRQLLDAVGTQPADAGGEADQVPALGPSRTRAPA